MDLNNILVVADPAGEAQAGWHRAVDIARASAGAIDLFGVVHHPLAETRSGALDASEQRDLRHTMLAHQRTVLDELAKPARAAGLSVTVDVVWNRSVHAAVQARVAAQPCDVVMKSAHRSPRIVRTPTDWHLLRELDTAVWLVVKPRRSPRRRILVTVDLQAVDRAHARLNDGVVAAARSVATLHSAELHLCHAINIPEALSDLDIIDAGKWAERVRKQVATRLAELAARLDIPVDRIHQPVARPDRGVIGVARELRAETIVLGTVARRGARGLLIGNTAEQVLAHADCDVLAVHA